MPQSESRPLRVCDVCGQVDDHPRHEFLDAAGTFPLNESVLAGVIDRTDLDAQVRARIAAEVVDTSRQQRHMDCCREVGCPDGSCARIAATGAEGLTGAKLLKHLTSGKVDHLSTASKGA